MGERAQPLESGQCSACNQRIDQPSADPTRSRRRADHQRTHLRHGAAERRQVGASDDFPIVMTVGFIFVILLAGTVYTTATLGSMPLSPSACW